jgi:hypothetical protein
MRGGAVDLTVLQGLAPNTPYVCGSTRIDQAAALGKIEAYDSIYNAVRGIGAGGRQAAIAGIVQAAAAAGGAATPSDIYIVAHPNYVGLYKSGGNFYTVAINKAPGTVASDPGNAVGAALVGRPAIAAAAGGVPGPLLTVAGAGAAVQADYILVEA